MSYDPQDRETILNCPCPLCGDGIVRSIGMELFCTGCLTAYVEEVIDPKETAYRENVRRSHSRR